MRLRKQESEQEWGSKRVNETEGTREGTRLREQETELECEQD